YPCRFNCEERPSTTAIWKCALAARGRPCRTSRRAGTSGGTGSPYLLLLFDVDVHCIGRPSPRGRDPQQDRCEPGSHRADHARVAYRRGSKLFGERPEGGCLLASGLPTLTTAPRQERLHSD